MLSTNDNQQVAKKILRLKDVTRTLGISRSTLYDWLNPSSSRYDLTFPKQIRLGQNSVGWLEPEIEQWILQRRIKNLAQNVLSEALSI